MDPGIGIATYGAGISTVVVVQALASKRQRLRLGASSVYDRQRKVWSTNVMVGNRGPASVAIFYIVVDFGDNVFASFEHANGNSHYLAAGTTARFRFDSHARVVRAIVQDDLARRFPVKVTGDPTIPGTTPPPPEDGWGLVGPLPRNAPVDAARSPRVREARRRAREVLGHGKRS